MTETASSGEALTGDRLMAVLEGLKRSKAEDVPFRPILSIIEQPAQHVEFRHRLFDALLQAVDARHRDEAYLVVERWMRQNDDPESVVRFGRSYAFDSLRVAVDRGDAGAGVIRLLEWVAGSRSMVPPTARGEFEPVLIGVRLSAAAKSRVARIAVIQHPSGFGLGSPVFDMLSQADVELVWKFVASSPADIDNMPRSAVRCLVDLGFVGISDYLENSAALAQNGGHPKFADQLRFYSELVRLQRDPRELFRWAVESDRASAWAFERAYELGVPGEEIRAGIYELADRVRRELPPEHAPFATAFLGAKVGPSRAFAIEKGILGEHELLDSKEVTLP